jgi:hypothetical protein
LGITTLVITPSECASKYLVAAETRRKKPDRGGGLVFFAVCV